MRLHICAVGRSRAGPEADLVDDYVQRASRMGRGLGLGPLRVQAVEDKKGGGPQGEAALLRNAVPRGASIVALDERGQCLTSPAFANRLARQRDFGCSDLAFLIGGADGLDPSLRDAADLCLSFGPMVWPHMLARLMLAEQIYRATTILAGTPYHRG